MIGAADHVGVAVRHLDEAIVRYRKLGFEPEPAEEVPSQGVRVAFLTTVGASLELIESLRGDGVIARFIERRGEGLHHVAFRTRDIRAELERLGSEGFELIDQEPRPGARGRRVAFLHPRSAHGVLIELVEEMAPRPAR